MIAHNCEPNAYIDWKTMELKALRPISLHELVTYHYGTIEDDYSIGAFSCTCEASHCINLEVGPQYRKFPALLEKILE